MFFAVGLISRAIRRKEIERLRKAKEAAKLRAGVTGEKKAEKSGDFGEENQVRRLPWPAPMLFDAGMTQPETEMLLVRKVVVNKWGKLAAGLLATTGDEELLLRRVFEREEAGEASEELLASEQVRALCSESREA